MMLPHANSKALVASRLLNSKLRLRETVLAAFGDPAQFGFQLLMNLSDRQWSGLLRWLDTSGLALMFLERMRELDLVRILPAEVQLRLERNLADNSQRIGEMIAESVAIQRHFQRADLSYAALKGFSLWPVSVPRLELRSQLDLDFLIAEEGAEEARTILEDFGYRLHAVSGRSWEFKADEDRPASLATLYKAGGRRSAELHLEAKENGNGSVLSRTRELCFHGVYMPVLAPVDLFLGQGLHLYKHLSNDFVRAAHLVEFRRHVVARFDDATFWSNLRRRVGDQRETPVRLGVVVLLIERLMGRFAPDALTSWTADRVPGAARLWVDLYGPRTALASFPGTKLYLLLVKELAEVGVGSKRSLGRALLPRRLPPAIGMPVEGETAGARLNRLKTEVGYIVFRLRFHFVEGLRLVCESILWRRYRSGRSQ